MSSHGLAVGTEVTYRYTPVPGFPPIAGRGEVREVRADRVMVHPQGTGHAFTIHLYPREVTPSAQTPWSQPELF